MLPVGGMIICNEPPSQLPVNTTFHIIQCTISQHMHEKSKHIILMTHHDPSYFKYYPVCSKQHLN